MHRRLSVLGTVFAASSIGEVLEACKAAGASNVGLAEDMITEAAVSETPTDLRTHDVQITHAQRVPYFHFGRDPDEDRESMLRLISAARALGISYIYGPAGGILPLEWEEGAAAFTRAVEPLRPFLEKHGVTLLVEPTNYLWADISFLHTLRDTVDLAEIAGVGVCIDVQHCWSERGLRETIRRAAPRIGLVQISDLIPDRHERFRAVPGDGALPLLRIMDWVLEAGYEGNFDLELSPEPGTDPRETVVRAVDRTVLLLEQLGL